MPDQPRNPRVLTVSVIGEPNAGKSTLINRVVGSKVSAVSWKSHTTRETVLGIATIENTQLYFVDTPGLMDTSASSKVIRNLGLTAWSSTEQSDVILLIVDAVKSITGTPKIIL